MPVPLACDMTAIPADERGVHQSITRRLMASATTSCPFLAFVLTVSPDRGPLDLRMTGPEGVTAFLRAELHLPAA